MEDEKFRDDLTVEEAAFVMGNMRRASNRAQTVAAVWFYLLLAVGLFLLNWYVVAAAFIPAARIIWVRWRDRWVYAQG